MFEIKRSVERFLERTWVLEYWRLKRLSKLHKTLTFLFTNKATWGTTTCPNPYPRGSCLKKWGFSLGFQGGIIVKGSQCYVPSGWLLLLPRIQALRTGLREKQKPGSLEANCQATWRFVFLYFRDETMIFFFSRFKNRIPSLQCHYRRCGIQRLNQKVIHFFF